MTNKINTKELGKDLQVILETKEIKVNNTVAKDIVESLFDAIFERIKNGDTVKLGKYADLEPRNRAARKGVNPALLKELKEQGVPEAEARKQAEIDIAEKLVAGFKTHKKLEELLNS